MFKGETHEIESIEKTIQLYEEAFNEWDISKLVRAYHPDSMVYWFVPESNRFYNGLCYRWVEEFVKNQVERPEVNYYVNIERINQYGTVAYARVRFLIEDPQDYRDTTDYLTLMKFDSQWKVVNKSGHTIPLEQEELVRRINGDISLPSNDSEEIKRITDNLEIYAQAFHDWDMEKIKQTFHPSMRMNSVVQETHQFKNQFRPYAVWGEVLENHKAEGITFETEIKQIDQRGTAAVAVMYWKATTPEGTGHTTDFLTLLKIENSWKIVNKSCHFYFIEK
ncbi:MAG: nuclear transport factor 2 family protein [Candidatus Heimdallarchaeota archaeon]|nr:nuclear transport factor 2 family protein [Candidatus Heimdallarchaeota archaeon]MCK5142803.1 nuclear transport factor 2 family protein [Candidatus Heimdallarchaeota archaeon]